jgi:protein SCO1/2
MKLSARGARPALLLVLVLLAAAAGAIVALATGQSGTPATTSASGSTFAGAALAPVAAPGFTLTEPGGRAVSLASLRGRPVVVAFLYSACGPACTLIAQQIRGALDELPRPVPVLVVSVDPAADDDAGVRRFLAGVSLLGRARWLSGPPRELARVWHAYRIVTPGAGRAAFERAATVVLIDGAGRERVLYQQEQLTPEALAHDIGRLGGG